MKLRKTDLFTIIHKAIRSMIYDSASKLQITDFTNYEESSEILKMLVKNLELLHEHAIHEDNIIFPEIANDEPEMIEMLNDEHEELEQKLKNILTQIGKLSDIIEKSERIENGNDLLKMFNDFAASYLAHMNHEEETVLEASFKYLSDEELIAIRTRIQTQIPSERYKIWLDWMLGSMNNTELIGLISGLKTSAPKQILENVMDSVRVSIAESRLETINAQLELLN
ncbi:MAG: hypothetical protein KatS3mg036_1086 [Ignavibacterium sp.]|nr:MAG: hypothetical protein KatS3mg036_1086 [Ignavibacterium sp.]